MFGIDFLHHKTLTVKLAISYGVRDECVKFVPIRCLRTLP